MAFRREGLEFTSPIERQFLSSELLRSSPTVFCFVSLETIPCYGVLRLILLLPDICLHGGGQWLVCLRRGTTSASASSGR